MLQNASTTCTYANPQQFDGSAPSDNTQPFAFQSSICATSYSYAATASSTSLTAGESVIAFFLFFILLFAAFSFFLDRIIGVRIRKNAYNTIMGNNSREGKKIYDD